MISCSAEVSIAVHDMTFSITYFVFDLDDPAVARRLRMLSLGGASVKLAVFHRSEKPVSSVDGIQAVDLGETEPAKLLSRTLSVAKTTINLNAASDALRKADVIVARNLEMLLLAVRARNRLVSAMHSRCLRMPRYPLASLVSRTPGPGLCVCLRIRSGSKPIFRSRVPQPSYANISATKFTLSHEAR